MRNIKAFDEWYVEVFRGGPGVYSWLAALLRQNVWYTVAYQYVLTEALELKHLPLSKIVDIILQGVT
jgi:hypothetical protein